MSGYQVSGHDDSADGMERLRCQSEFILLTYPRQGDTADSLLAELVADLDSVMRPDGFNYEAAADCLLLWFEESGGRSILESILAELPPAEEEEEAEEPDAPCVTFRLYVTAPDGMAG